MIKDATYMRNLANQETIQHFDTSSVDTVLVQIEDAAREGWAYCCIRDLDLEQIQVLQVLGFKVELGSPKGGLHSVGW